MAWWILPVVAVAVGWFLTRNLWIALAIGVATLLLAVGVMNVDFNLAKIIGVFT